MKNNKPTYIRKLFLTIIIVYLFIFIALFIIQGGIFRRSYTRRVINNSTSEIDNLFSNSTLADKNDSLIEFSQNTQTSSILLSEMDLRQDITIINLMSLTVTDGSSEYNILVPRNDYVENSTGKVIISEINLHINSGYYIPKYLSIGGRNILMDKGGMMASNLLKSFSQGIDYDTTISINSTIDDVTSSNIINDQKYNTLASNEILNILTENYTDLTRTSNGYYYTSQDNDGNYTNLVFFSKNEIEGQSYILIAVYPLAHIDDVVNAVKYFNFIIFTVLFIVLIIISVFYSNSFAKPIKKLNLTTIDIAELKFDSKHFIDDREDEFGDLSKNIRKLSINLKQSLSKLELQNKQLSDSLSRENVNETERKNFVRGFSHEIKTPLAVIQATSEAIEGNIFKDVSSKKEALKSIQSEVKRINSIINNMMDIYKIDTAGYKDNWKTFNVKKPLDELIKSYSALLQNRNLSFDLEIDSYSILGDSEKIELVFSNLISNAIKYATENSTISISAQDKLDAFEFSISNAVQGLEKEELSSIFDPFYTIDKSMNKDHSGSGLGLYIVKQILKQYNSTCEVRLANNIITFSFKIIQNKK